MAPGSKRPAREPDEAMERRLVSRELGKAKRNILALRNFYIINAVLWGVLFFIFFGLGAGRAAKAIVAGILACMVIGIFQIRKQPVVWGVVIAAIWTLWVVFWLFQGRDFTIMFIVEIGWTLGCWALIPATIQANKLIQAYPDLWISKQMRPGGRARRAGRRR